MFALTHTTIAEFAQEASWTARAKAIERVATLYAEGRLAPAERPIALELVRLALDDAEPLVRRVVAESLKHARDLPPEIVRALATDLPAVSAPFLAASPLIGEAELIAIAKDGATAQRDAIAHRPRLPAAVLDALHAHTAAA